MQVEAIYKHGRVELLQPLRLKRDNFRVTVNIPSEELLNDSRQAPVDVPGYKPQPEVSARQHQVRARLDAILNAPYPPDDELPELGSEYEERVQAFALRAQLRAEQGRPE